MTKFRSGCKINLALSITGKRPDGWHSLKSVFFPLNEPCDSIEITPAPEGSFSLRCDAAIPGKNILEKAWSLFMAETGEGPGAAISLVKGVPMGAGLGGASANAAILLLWLNGQLSRPLPALKLLELAARIGADVPFFIENTPAFATGIGERLAHWPNFPQFWALLVWPGIVLDTAKVFQAYDCLISKTPLTNHAHVDKKIWQYFWPYDLLPGQNDLENAAISICPALAELKREILACEPAFAGMSGSGSSFFGVFFSQDKAELARKSLSGKYCHVYLASSK